MAFCQLCWRKSAIAKVGFLSLFPCILIFGMLAAPADALDIKRLGSYQSPTGEGAAEIAAYDAGTQRLFVTNATNNALDILNISNPRNPILLNSIDLNPFGAGVNSVAAKNGVIATAVEANPITNNGNIVFFDPVTGNQIGTTVQVGALPDMLTFTPDGQRILVANEGEPENGTDSLGSISIIDISGGFVNPTVTTAGFTSFDGQETALRAAGVRIFPGRSFSEDVEPEYITISNDSSTAWVSLQENNALAKVDIASATVTAILPLLSKDHSLPGQGIDPSDRDTGIDIRQVPVSGLYMPDAIASFRVNGQTFIVSANEGDDRGEDERVGNLTLDPTAFPDAATLQLDENLGRLGVSTIDGDPDGDGDYDQLFAYGARSFSIWDENGNLVFDSGDDFERLTASLFPAIFNADESDPDEFDNRSDNKGSEPEGVTLGIVSDRTYSFVGLERIGGFMVYDVTDPSRPFFVEYVNDYLLGDIAPEGLLFIAANESPTGRSLLVVTNEVSGTTSIYSVSVPDKSSATLGLLMVGVCGWITRKKPKFPFKN